MQTFKLKVCILMKLYKWLDSLNKGHYKISLPKIMILAIK